MVQKESAMSTEIDACGDEADRGERAPFWMGRRGGLDCLRPAAYVSWPPVLETSVRTLTERHRARQASNSLLVVQSAATSSSKVRPRASIGFVLSGPGLSGHR